MRTETIIKTYLTFDELSEDQREKVIEKNRDINIYNDWDDCMIEDLHGVISMFGFRDVDISYSGFCSQGDGASFTAKMSSSDLISISKHSYLYRNNSNLHELITMHNALIKMGKAFDAEVTRTCHRYSHVNTVETSVDYDGTLTEQEMELINNKLNFIKRRLCEYCYSRLESEYNYRLSDEAIEETLDGLEFDSETLETIY